MPRAGVGWTGGGWRRLQPEEDQLGQLAGAGDDADVAAAAGGDVVADLPETGVRGYPLDGLDRGPPHQPAAYLGDPARCTVVSDSWCFGVSPAHEANCSGVPKRVMSPISATNTAARIGPTSGMVWIARYPGCSRNRLVTSRAKVSTSKSSAAISRSSESTRERD